jgi:hypothetical protein
VLFSNLAIETIVTPFGLSTASADARLERLLTNTPKVGAVSASDGVISIAAARTGLQGAWRGLQMSLRSSSLSPCMVFVLLLRSRFAGG